MDMCVFWVCASLANLQIESVLLRLGSNLGSQKRLGERHEVEGQKEKDKNNKERISSSLKQIDNPDQSLMELEGKDQMLLCVCVCVCVWCVCVWCVCVCVCVSIILFTSRVEQLGVRP